MCRGVSLGHFAVPVPILSLFTKSCCMCIKRSPCSGCLCVYVESFEERGDYIQAFLSPPPPPAQDIQVKVSIVSECMAECL